MFEIVEKSLK